MKQAVIRKKELANFLDALIGQYKVLAPVRSDDLVIFQEIHAGKEAFLDSVNSLTPPKKIFFPQSERMFAFSLDKGEVKVKEPLPEEKRVIFGIRPCDAKSVVILDNVFDGEMYKDAGYVDKREKTVVIALGCNRPGSTCFCTSLGGSPFSTDGSDLLLVDIGEEYVAQVITEKGGKLLEEQNEYFGEAGEHGLETVNDVIRTAEALMKPAVAVEGLKERLDGIFADEIWRGLSEKCLGCAICTYFCPTCHCFDIVDEAIDHEGERVRIWDSCMFPLFTLQASGVNPRPTGKERMRQRIMHKFSYFVDNHGEIACVGCGRCIRNCPVNLDIRELLNSLSNQQEGKCR